MRGVSLITWVIVECVRSGKGIIASTSRSEGLSAKAQPR